MPDPNAGGLVINWQMFGSSGQEKADYSRGVLERFMRRATNRGITEDEKNGNKCIKTIDNPRIVNFINSPHRFTFFEGSYYVNETGKIVTRNINYPLTVDKIVINHYYCKSREEFKIKKERGDVVYGSTVDKAQEQFKLHDRNDEFDDGILHYRDERAKTYQPPDKSRADERLLNALMENLSPTLLPNTPPKFFAGKMETFLTCRAVSSYLKTKLPDATAAKFFEETSLKAILYSFGSMTLADARIFLRELPQLLSLPYPVVSDIRNAAIQIIPQILNVFHMNGMWRDYIELDYLLDMLKLNK